MKLTKEQFDYVQTLADKNGKIRPDRVVAAAKSPKSPIHGKFQWDKNKAAMTAWLQTAREIIGYVQVVRTNNVTEIQAIGYVRDPSLPPHEQGYLRTDAVQAHSDQARKIVTEALHTAAGHLRRAVSLAEQFGLSQEIDKLIHQILGMRREQPKRKAA